MRVNGTSIPLAFPTGTRVGWVITGALLTPFGMFQVLFIIMLIDRAPASTPFLAAMGALYLWLGIAAIDVARARPHLTVHGDRIELRHRGLIAGTLVVPRAQIERVAVDPRSRVERGVAARTRRRGFASASFIDLRIPVLSASPSSLSRTGTRRVPNVVLHLATPLRWPKVSLGARFLLRVAQGKHGSYDGPKTRREMRAVRLVVDDARAAADAFGDLVEHSERDAQYLAPLTARNYARARREKLYVALGGALLVLIISGITVARAALGS